MIGSASNEPVLRQLETLLEQKAGAAPDQADWQADVKEGNARASRKEPPGYLDADKTDCSVPEGAAGDYLVWCQTLREAARRNIDVLLITGDACGQRLFMMRPISLLRRAAILKITVRNESVDDVERVSRESPTTPVWSAAGVAALLERLETEGWEHADVIRVAAARGGQISRSEIYQVCGYEDDRMLRGFSRPTTRITADLQNAGIVADGVEPALSPIYIGVKAAAFRIPTEMAAILAADSGTPPATEV